MMIQYLIILLDDTSVSFCHYDKRGVRNLMPTETLKAGIMYGMKENLNIQFVYPNYELPEEYLRIINTIDHTDIKPLCGGDVDILVADSCSSLLENVSEGNGTYVLRTNRQDLFANYKLLCDSVGKMQRLNVVLTDVEKFTEEDFKDYEKVLDCMCDCVCKSYVEGKPVQVNILTDRIMLDKMNNCGAGDISVTLAPDGRFYVCPAFYYANDGSAVGDLEHGLDIKNSQLYKLDYAPLCRICDAYQCKRCVWLNRKTTLEVNTPSHEQCVVAHLERNASRKLLADIRKHGSFMPEREIKEITYLDPFEIKEQW